MQGTGRDLRRAVVVGIRDRYGVASAFSHDLALRDECLKVSGTSTHQNASNGTIQLA